MRLGNFSYSPTQLLLGALSGNEFRLLMRGVVPESGSGADKVRGVVPEAGSGADKVRESQ